MASISLEARGVIIHIPDLVVAKLQREQGLSFEEIKYKFARSVDRIIDEGKNTEYFMMR